MKQLIRYILIFSLMMSLVYNAIAQSSNKEKFNKGVTLFTSGSYKEALQEWIDIYNTGIHSANLDYNIGNAYFKLNDIPDAILFYERAYLLNPADDNINYNLNIARSRTVDKFQAIPELFFVKWYDFVSLFLSSNTWAKISLSSFVICLLLISLYIYSGRYKSKVLGFWLAILFFVFSSATLVFARHNRSLVYNSHKAIISSPLINGKSSPDDSGTDLFVLHEGTKVKVGDKVGDWYEIRLSDGNKGWVPVKSLNII